MRQFNIAGPMVAGDHYVILPLSRMDLNELLGLVRDKKYFVLHAPRQTGKTSALLALRDLLNDRDDYRWVYANVESARPRARTWRKACAPCSRKWRSRPA